MIGVMTTIQGPTESVRGLLAALAKTDTPLLVMGDKKGPERFDVDGAELLGIEAQLDTGFALAELLPTGHYCRKNIGYLLAFRRGADCIYETDDDNAPLDSWAPRSLSVDVEPVAPRPWLNVYRVFSDELIWPRGFPLARVTDPAGYAHDGDAETIHVDAPIQQGLADSAPDVDAVWRLVLDREFFFDRRPSVYLPAGTWCPFNSQSTWWWPAAYPLMYLPSYCSFRMTDIWRSFIAQRCLWELGCGMVFHAAEVIQERNVHNLMRDFADEVPGYNGNEDLVRRLSDLSLRSGPGPTGENLLACYECLVQADYFPDKELALVQAWLDDLGAAAG